MPGLREQREGAGSDQEEADDADEGHDMRDIAAAGAVTHEVVEERRGVGVFVGHGRECSRGCGVSGASSGEGVRDERHGRAAMAATRP